jgi:hypothetical protein
VYVKEDAAAAAVAEDEEHPGCCSWLHDCWEWLEDLTLRKLYLLELLH